MVAISELTDAQRQTIARAAAARGFEALFFDGAEAALPALADAEVVFGQDARLAQNAPKLRWLCSPFAGVDKMCIRDSLFPSSWRRAAMSAAFLCADGLESLCPRRDGDVK